MLSKKYYEAIAKILAKNDAKPQLIDDFMYLFASDNPRFSATKFRNNIKEAKEQQNLESNSNYLDETSQEFLERIREQFAE